MPTLQQDTAERLLYRNMSVTKVIATSDDHSAAFLRLITCLAGFSIFIQKVTFSITVENASEITVQSTDSTPVKYAEIQTPTTEGPVTFDFGQDGVQVTEDKHLDFRNSAAGMALIVYVQAYMKPTATLVAKAVGVTGQTL